MLAAAVERVSAAANTGLYRVWIRVAGAEGG